MGETRPCPECGVENTISRITCQVCHAWMDKKVENTPAKEKKIAKEKPKKRVSKVDKVESRTEPYVNPFDGSNDFPSSKPTKKSTPPVIIKGTIKSPVKHRRRKSKLPEPTTFFVLQKGKLQAVNVRLAVKSLKTKEISGLERNLIAMWNRNKDLFTK